MPKYRSANKQSRKWAFLSEFEYYAVGVPILDTARRLRLSERHVRRMLAGHVPVPWWTVELLRLKHLDAIERSRQMTGGVPKPRLARVNDRSPIQPEAPAVQSQQEPVIAVKAA